MSSTDESRIKEHTFLGTQERISKKDGIRENVFYETKSIGDQMSEEEYMEYRRVTGMPLTEDYDEMMASLITPKQKDNKISLEKFLLEHRDYVYALASKNTKLNEAGQVVISEDDEWRNEPEWDELFSELTSSSLKKEDESPFEKFILEHKHYIYALASKNTKLNEAGQAVISKDDEWRTESEWDELFSELISSNGKKTKNISRVLKK